MLLRNSTLKESPVKGWKAEPRDRAKGSDHILSTITVGDIY